jgi:hypothetical protein
MCRILPPAGRPPVARLGTLVLYLWLALMPAAAADAQRGTGTTGTATTGSSGDSAGRGTREPSSGPAVADTQTVDGTTSPTTSSGPTAKARKCRSMTGNVTSKDFAAKTFTVHPKSGADRSFSTTDETTFWEGKTKASWADLATGRNVFVTCTTDGVIERAKSVWIHKAKNLKAPAKDAGDTHNSTGGKDRPPATSIHACSLGGDLASARQEC